MEKTDWQVVVALQNGYTVDYEQAQEYCREGGGDIASITNSDDGRKIEDKMRALSLEWAWIGLRQSGSDWSNPRPYWEDGTRFGYTRWAQYQPSKLAHEQNVVLAIDSSWGDGWHDS